MFHPFLRRGAFSKRQCPSFLLSFCLSVCLSRFEILHCLYGKILASERYICIKGQRQRFFAKLKCLSLWKFGWGQVGLGQVQPGQIGSGPTFFYFIFLNIYFLNFIFKFFCRFLCIVLDVRENLTCCF